jgi:hypothetical protein
MNPLKQAVNTNYHILSEDTIGDMFANLEQICIYHKRHALSSDNNEINTK